MFDFDDEFDEQIVGFADYSFEALPRTDLVEQIQETASSTNSINVQGSAG